MSLAALLLACGGPAPEPAPPPPPPAPAVRLGAPLVLPSGPGAAAPHLAAEGHAVRLTWFAPRGEGHALLTSTRGLDGSWTAPATIAESTGFVVNWADTPSVTAGGDGRLVAHHPERSGEDPYAYDVVLSRSDDGGATWTRLGPAHDDHTPTEHGFVSAWPTAAGVGLAWLDGREVAGGGAMTLRTAEVGAESTSARVLDARVCDCCGTSATVAADGVPVVAYRDRSDEELRDIRLVRLDGSGDTAVSADRWQIAGCPVNGPRVAAVGDHLVVAWTTGATGSAEVRAAVSEDRGRSFGQAVVVAGGDPAPLGRVDLISDGRGGAVLSWLQARGGEVAEVRVARVQPVGSDLLAGEPRPLGLAEASRGSGFPRIALQGGNVVGVWSEPSGGLVGGELALGALPAPTGALPDAVLGAVGQPSAPAALAPLRGTTLGGDPWELPTAGPLVVSLWASWCGPCRGELPHLRALAAGGLRVAVVAVDDQPERARALLGDTGLDVGLVDAAGVRGAFGAAEVPATTLFDADGRVAWVQRGALDAEGMAALRAAAAGVTRSR